MSDGWFLLIFWAAAWLAVLYRILTRPDFEPTMKLLWVVVVIFVPFFGVLLYWFAAPSEVLPETSLRKKIVPGSDVSGTPWADNPGYTQIPRR